MSLLVKQEEFLSLGNSQGFELVRPSTDWIRPTSIRQSNLFYPVFQFNVNPIQKHLHRNNQIDV